MKEINYGRGLQLQKEFVISLIYDQFIRLEMQRENVCDSLCFCQTCVQQKKGLFNSSEEEYHFTDHKDKVHPIHYKTILDLLGSQSVSQKFRFKAQCKNLQQLLRSHLQKNNTKILEYLTKKIIQPTTKQFMEYTQRCKNDNEEAKLTPHSIVNRLKNGDLELFENIYQYQKKIQKYQKTLCLTSILTLNKMKEHFRTVLNQLDEQTNNILVWLQLTLKTYGDLKYTMIQQDFKDGINDSKKEVSKIFNKKQNQPLIKKQYIPPKEVHKPHEYQIKMHPMVLQHPKIKQQYIQSRHESSPQGSQDEGTQQKFDELGKTKSIKKADKKIRKKIQIEQQQLSLNENQIQWTKKQKKQIKICHSSKPQRTLQTLIQNYKDIQSLHIFSYNFCKRPQVISTVLQKMPFLKEITFNCNHDLSIQKLSTMQPKTVQKLNKIQLRWQFSKFFSQYFILHDFPYKKQQVMQKSNPIQTQQKNYKFIPSNKSLLIQSDQHIRMLANSQFNFQKIRVLHFCTTIKNISGKVKLLNDLRNLRNLHTLHLNSVTFPSIQDKFDHFIKENKELQIIVFSQCIFNSSANKVLSSLKQLLHLKKLAIYGRSPIRIRSNIITSLSTLISLYLNNIIFEEQENGIAPQQNSQVLKDFIKLRKLKSLSLYNCQPIFSDFFKYIHEDINHSLELLSLGITNIDDKCFEYLLKMKNLKLLNIDSCKIQGTAFCQYLKKYQINEKKKLGLSMLSIANKRQKKNFKEHQMEFLMTDLIVIGSLLPQLKYINVYRRHELQGYNFKEFNKLKILCVGFSMYKQLSKKREDLKLYVIKDH